MRWNLLKLIPATLLFFSFACSPPFINSKNAMLSEKEFSSLSQSETPSLLPNSSLLDKKELPTDEFWDTSWVDISHVDGSRKLIALTFDDAPASTLENILAVFASFNESHPHCKASATIFFNGARLDTHTMPLLYAACALGFELGNHGYTHRALTGLSKENCQWEIQETDKLLSHIDGREHHLLRAPFGRIDDNVKAFSYTPLIDWTIDTNDWTGASEESIYDSVFSRKFSGAIVLMHDGYQHTVSALKRLLPDLVAEGYQIVGVSEMIKAHDCRFRRGQVYIRARKQNGGR